MPCTVHPFQRLQRLQSPLSTNGGPSQNLMPKSNVPYVKMNGTNTTGLEAEMQRVNIVVLGAQGVGKTSIVRQFVNNQFSEKYASTRTTQCYYPSVIINEHLYEVKIIDCPMIPYFPLSSLCEWTNFRGYGLRSASAYILVYDVTNEESFNYIRSIREQILECRNGSHEVPIFVVGNKHDMGEDRTLPTGKREIASTVKKQWKCAYIESSAKYNWHIVMLFKELMRTIDYLDSSSHKATSMRGVQDALRRQRCTIL